MPFLQYKTRGDSSPQGKPRVFFCCHPQDHAACFDRICNEILAKQNCAFYWYAPDAAVPAEERSLDLGQMQLFVMPVTRQLLTGDNRGILDFDYAIAHHIPVLPLLQETGLEELFNRRCGDLQFLDKNAVDATAISYDEKLEKFLASVLVGDALAAQVRAAFDAYVFLSYRKKDRKYAQELMRLIHKNDFCRDIAIWYDEFLAPGENFNDSIRDAMQKSRLFALVVTPNLINEPNYVASVEYPMACSTAMQVLPAQLVPTDTAALQAMYAGIAVPTDAHDDAALTAALLDRVQALDIATNNGDPQHNFFIGLAYLSGIDVEVDHQKALALIQDAANAGLLQAVEKLISMYRTGEGVARDYRKAVEWQKKRIQLWKKEYAAAPTAQNGETLCREHWRLAEYLIELNEYEQVLQVGEDLLQTAQAMQQFDLHSIRRYQCIGSACLGRAAEALDRLPQAMEYYEQALQFSRQLAEQDGTVQAQLDLVNDLYRVGDFSRRMGDLKKAESCYAQGLAICRTVMETTQDAVYIRERLALGCERMGNLVLDKGDLEAAQRYFEQNQQLWSGIAAEEDSDSSRRSLLVAHRKLGNLALDMDDLDAAWQQYDTARQITEQLHSGNPTLLLRRDLSIVYGQLAQVCKKKNDYAQARQFIMAALQIDKALIEEKNLPQDRDSLATDYRDMGRLCEQENDLDGAKRYYEQRLAVVSGLLEQAQTPEYRSDLSGCYNDLGLLAEKAGDLAAAKGYYLQCLAIDRQIAQEKGTLTAWFDLSVTYENLAFVARDQKDYASARQYYTESLQIMQMLAPKTTALRVHRGLATSHVFLAGVALQENDRPTAVQHYRKAVELRRALAEKTGAEKDKENLELAVKKLQMLENEAAAPTAPEKAARPSEQPAPPQQQTLQQTQPAPQQKPRKTLLSAILDKWKR